MKLNINKVTDLSSISVLPPHSRRLNTMNSGVDAYGLGRIQASQLRSQSQQSFSQGLSQSQISQSSFDNLGSDQKIDSQEREKSSKRISSLVPIMPLRDDSQMQLSGTSSNAMRRWSCATAPDNKCHVSEELEHRLRLLESSLSKVGMILDSLQSDVMQVNRARFVERIPRILLKISLKPLQSHLFPGILQQCLDRYPSTTLKASPNEIFGLLRFPGSLSVSSSSHMIASLPSLLPLLAEDVPTFPIWRSTPDRPPA